MTNFLFVNKWNLVTPIPSKYTVLSRASAHGCSQLKCQKVRVGGYMEKVLKWFNHPHARTHPGCKVKCQKVRVGGYMEKVLKWFNHPHARTHPGCKVSCQGVLHCCFVRASSTVEKAVSCYIADRLVASLPSFRNVQSLLAVRKFRAAVKEHCERGHRRVCVNLWCLMSWCPKRIRTIATMWAMQKFSMVGSCTENLEKSQNCQNWGVGTCSGMGACLGNTVHVQTAMLFWSVV